MSGQDWIEKDFYAALGVPKNADDAAIKKAYRKLARQYHPDQNAGDPRAEAKFKEVGEAYAVLSDKEQRQQYDAIRALGGGGARFQAGGPGGAGFEDIFGGMFGGPGGAQFGGAGRTRAGGAGGFEDILSGMFGGAARTRRQRGADLEAATTLEFRTATEGATVELGVDGKKVTTRIPAGVNDGQKLRIRGKGRPGMGGGEDGDLVLTVHVKPHPVFSLAGRDLRLTVPITFAEAALGAQVEVPTLTGDPVTVKVPAGTPSGRVLRVKGRGVVTPKGTGDLLVSCQVVVPQKLSRAAKQALEAFAAEADSAADVRADLLAQAGQA